MGKIAVQLQQALQQRRQRGEPGRAVGRPLAAGDGWSVGDVTCTSGPGDRPFEERHTRYTIAIVLAGSFQYRSPLGRTFLSPGSLLLANQGHCYECGHQHGAGDRCVSFYYQADYFDRLASDVGAPRARLRFGTPRVPPLDHVAPFAARAAVGAIGAAHFSWEELAVRLAAQTLRLAAGMPVHDFSPQVNAEARVARVVRAIDDCPGGDLRLSRLARESGLSPYHFLRTFERLIGITPHRYVLRARLREAATRLVTESRNVSDVAFESGFGDVSNFTHAFRREFGVSPRAYRRLSYS